MTKRSAIDASGERELSARIAALEAEVRQIHEYRKLIAETCEAHVRGDINEHQVIWRMIGIYHALDANPNTTRH